MKKDKQNAKKHGNVAALRHIDDTRHKVAWRRLKSRKKCSFVFSSLFKMSWSTTSPQQ